MCEDHLACLGAAVHVTVDRPLGTYHPRTNSIFYTVNYGYVEGVPGGDGHWQDVYLLGVDKPVKEYDAVVIAVILRRDDVETKWVAAPAGRSFTKEQIWEQVRFVEAFYDTEIFCG